MNILPKKRWHVRTRENIARVRRDEAKAAEEEKQRLLRVEKAEREARTELLRKKARVQYNHENKSEDKPRITSEDSRHVNLFYELEQDFVIDKTNPEYEKEKKLEKEKYEKQIGYLTYLGQDTNEITGNVSWYNRNPEERKNVVEEVSMKAKTLEDPLRDIKKYLGNDEKVSPKKESSDVQVKEEKKEREYEFLYKYSKMKKKSKKSKKHKKKRKRKHSESSEEEEKHVVQKKNVTLETLRTERMKREMEERKRAEMVLRKLRGEEIKEEKVEESQGRYNSQFNPHLAKQNFGRR